MKINKKFNYKESALIVACSPHIYEKDATKYEVRSNNTIVNKKIRRTLQN